MSKRQLSRTARRRRAKNLSKSEAHKKARRMSAAETDALLRSMRLNLAKMERENEDLRRRA